MVDVILDASHGGADVGAVGLLGTKEKECTLYIAKVCKSILENKGIKVKLTREIDESIDGEVRSNIANKSGAKCFISIHLNNSDDKRESGLEVLTGNNHNEVSKLSVDILKSLSTSSKLNSRGIKETDLILFKEIDIPTAMVKLCFMTNLREEKLLLDKNFNKEAATLLANGIEEYLEGIKETDISDNTEQANQMESEMMKDNNLEYKEEDIKPKDTLTSIIGGEIPNKNQAKQWAKNRNANETIIKLVDLYWGLYEEKGRINPAIAFSQGLIELTKEGLVVEDISKYNNPGGLKEEKSEKYQKFLTWREGVEAHLDHLALYTGVAGYPDKNSKDPRHFSYLLGVCKFVENLAGKWSADANYGINILKFYYEILETQTKDVFRESIENIDGLKTQIGEFKSKVVLMGRTLEDVCKEYNQIYKSLEVLKVEIESLEDEKKKLKDKNIELTKNVDNQQKVLQDIAKIIGGNQG